MRNMGGLLFETDPILTCRVCGKRGPSTLAPVRSAVLNSTSGPSARPSYYQDYLQYTRDDGRDIGHVLRGRLRSYRVCLRFRRYQLTILKLVTK